MSSNLLLPWLQQLQFSKFHIEVISIIVLLEMKTLICYLMTKIIIFANQLTF